MLSKRRAFIAIAIGITISGILGWEIVMPLRHQIAERYITRGDVYLAAQDYEHAQAEYAKALRYDSTNQEARTSLDFANQGPTNPLAVLAFFKSHNAPAIVTDIERATQKFAKPKEALSAGVDFYKEGKFSLARYPIEQAVALDPEYPEAWHYLGLTYNELAKEDASYRAKSEDAWKHRDALTPAYISAD